MGEHYGHKTKYLQNIFQYNIAAFLGNALLVELKCQQMETKNKGFMSNIWVKSVLHSVI